MGNIASLHNAFAKVGADVCVAATPAELEPATHIVLPGVGAFPKGMHQLRSLGFEDALRRLVLEQGRLLLGVCLGMQLLATEGEEHELTAGLNFIPGRVVRFNAPANAHDLVPAFLVESTARSSSEITVELRSGRFAKVAERAGRAQDAEDGGGLETLRRDGYM